MARLAATDRILYRGCEKLLIGEDTLAARALFLQALELDSAYAPAWFRLSSVTPDGDPQGTAWARRAYRLDSLNKCTGSFTGKNCLLRENSTSASAVRAAFGARPDQSRQHSYSGDPVPAGRDALFGDRYARFGRDAFR